MQLASRGFGERPHRVKGLGFRVYAKWHPMAYLIICSGGALEVRAVHERSPA